jgi:hypothetical protein
VDDTHEGFSFSDPTHGWVVGQNQRTQAGFIASTSDGGQAWREQSLPVSVDVSTVGFAPGTTKGWRVVAATASVAGITRLASALQVTTDGVRWQSEFVPGDLQFIDQLKVQDALHAWISGTDQLDQGVVEATSDGGSTWVPVYPDTWTEAPGSAAPPAHGPFQPVPPVRICDTRPASATEPANQCSSRRVGAAANGGLETLDFATAGLAGLPRDPSQYSAVILHVTATGPDTSSYVTNFGSGIPRPLASNLNTLPNQTAGNLVEVATGSDGHLELFNAQGTTDLVVDVEGYVTTTAPATAGGFAGVTPFRACDTRPVSGANSTQCGGLTLSTNSTAEVRVTGLSGSNVPATGVSAVVLNATVTGPSRPGFLTIYPTGASRPLASSLNFAQGQVVANRVTVPVGPCSSGGGSCVTMYNLTGNVDAVLDITGYYTDGSGSSSGARFTALTPRRVCDTRAPSATNLTVCAGQSLTGGSPLTLLMAGADGIPAGATAVVANVTVTGASQGAYLTVYPGTAAQPLASDVNFTAGQTVPNLVVTALGSDGSIDLSLPWGTADVIVDVVGYYS